MNEIQIYQELKRQIIFTELEPGAVIREKEIMKAFKVSRTPVREALMRLGVDGLVRIIPNVGTFVEEVSFQQLRNVFELRSHLVRLAGEFAAMRITEDQLIEIRKRIEAMKSTDNTRALIELDGEIHQIINEASSNNVLVKMLKELHDQAIRFWAFSGAEGGYWNDLEKEFKEIAEALEQHDSKLSGQLLEKHTERFVDHIRSQLTF
jgi:DNA-binding GntR family transcriptional regulator